MTQVHLIETLIVGIILIALWYIGTSTDERLTVLEAKKDTVDYSRHQVSMPLFAYPIKEKSFKGKVKREEKRINSIIFHKDEAYLNGKKVKGYNLKVKKPVKKVK